MTSGTGLVKDFDRMKLEGSGLHSSGLAHEQHMGTSHIPGATTTTIREEKIIRKEGDLSSSSSEGEYEETFDTEGRPIKKKRGLKEKIKGMFHRKHKNTAE